MELERIQLIVYIISLVLTVIWLIFTIISRSKNKKLKQIAETTLEIIGYCRDAVEVAEKFHSYSGSAKKEYAMTYVYDLCMKNGISIDQEMISKEIEKLVSFSRKVNTKDGER